MDKEIGTVAADRTRIGDFDQEYIRMVEVSMSAAIWNRVQIHLVL